MPAALGAEGYSHRVLVHADRIDQLWLRAVGDEVFDRGFQRVGVHAFRVGWYMDDVGALAHQHSKCAGVAELLDEDGVSGINERVEDYADGSSRAGAEEDAIQRDVHAPVLTQ